MTSLRIKISEIFYPKAELNYDFFVAADVFEYVGDLSEIFNLIGSKNQKRGNIYFFNRAQ